MEAVKNSFGPGKVQRQTNPELLINWGFGKKEVWEELKSMSKCN